MNTYSFWSPSRPISNSRPWVTPNDYNNDYDCATLLYTRFYGVQHQLSIDSGRILVHLSVCGVPTRYSLILFYLLTISFYVSSTTPNLILTLLIFNLVSWHVLYSVFVRVTKRWRSSHDGQIPLHTNNTLRRGIPFVLFHVLINRFVQWHEPI